jgi:hypothetical protein
LSEPASHILRIQRDELERQLFGRRVFYVNVSRIWSRGTTVLFVKKDSFIGSGVVEKFVAADDMEESEKKLCSENNWYGRIAFSRLARFIPAVSVQGTPAAEQNPLALHGSSLSDQDAAKIERMAASRVVS